MDEHDREHWPSSLDPLGSLPSLTCLTRATGGPQPEEFSGKELEQALALDPICYLRTLRIACSAVSGKKIEAVPSPHELLEIVGENTVKGLLSATAEIVAEPAGLYKLWKHLIASAIAARSLAELSEDPELEPDRVYAHALVHDLDQLSRLASFCGTGKDALLGPLDWVRAWKIPDSVMTSWLGTRCATLETDRHGRLVRMVLAGEAVAILGGSTSPGNAGTVDEEIIQELDTTQLTDVGRRLNAEMAKRLQLAGLGGGVLDILPKPKDVNAVHVVASPIEGIERAILDMLDLGNQNAQRSLLAGMVGWSTQCLGFDRAFYFRWVGKGRDGMLSAGHDGSIHSASGRVVRPSLLEAQILGRTMGSRSPAVIERNETQSFTLLDHLASDRLLAVPVLGGHMDHGFLLLDHGYHPGKRISDAAHLAAMAYTGVCGQSLSNLYLKRKDERSQREAQTDHLTGLWNRRAVMERIQNDIRLVRERKQPMSILMLDLDHFKQCNDTYGHLMGDRVLAKVGAVLREILRETDVPARIGGEEFLVLGPNTTVEEAALIAARIYRAIEEAGQDLGVPITISIGVTDLRKDDSVDDVLSRADRALYASKELGRNRFSIDAE